VSADRARPGKRRPVALPAPSPGSTEGDPDAFTLPAGPAGAPRSPGPPPPPRRAAAVIVDHDDETSVFDPTGETRVRGEVPSHEDRTVAGPPPAVEDDDDAAATRALDVDMGETETIPVPVPLPGSR
jgi:hypothetical protein